MASLLLPVRRASVPEAVPLPVMGLGAAFEGSAVGLSLVRVDDGGVVAARTALSRLGWRGGARIGFEVSSGLVVVARSGDPAAVRVPSRMNLFLPARLRSRCRIGVGEQVLLASLGDHDLLVVYPQAVVQGMVIAYHGSLSDRLPRTPGS